MLSVQDCDAALTRPGSVFETTRLTIDGRDLRVWARTPASFPAFVRANFAKYADNVLVSSPIAAPEPYEAREVLTFAQVYDAAVRLGAVLREQGAGVGARVAIGGTNCTGWVVVFVAVHLIGAVPVLLNNGLHIAAQVHCLALTQPLITLVDDQVAAQLAPVLPELKAKGVNNVWAWGTLAHLPDVARVVTTLDSLSPSADSVAAVRAGTGIGLEGVGPESDGIIFFTSGTTSMPKGVLVTNRQALHVIQSGVYPLARMALRMGLPADEAIAMATAPRPDTVSLLSIPLFHVQGCLTWLVGAIDSGTKLVFLRRWSVAYAIGIMVQEKVTKIGGVPAICTAVLQSPLLPKDFTLTATSYGGAQPPTRLPRDLVARFPGMIPATGWGMTETNSGHCAFVGQEYIDKPLACGQVMPVTEIRIVDPVTKAELPAGREGLLLAKGQNVMKEYVNNAKATAEALTPDGWLDTGDIAFVDAFGDLHITDRAKDIIIRGGENVPAAEVERALALDDRVHEACAVAVPDDVLGERIGVAVSLAPGARATPLSVAEMAWPRLRYPARPDVVVVVEGNLPWNASQKVVKADVKKMVLDQWERQGRKPMVDPKARL
ncbi:hypothetical protein Q8F55_007395 [Vanrija albida]|uniref:AMP-dependent synthetase/ligase domain-containing protein n=1 Tax=Vanrija albida TaxID=181172 RepID=A0ABR3PTL8_9TREE